METPIYGNHLTMISPPLVAAGGSQTLAARAAAGCFANLAGAGAHEWYQGRLGNFPKLHRLDSDLEGYKRKIHGVIRKSNKDIQTN